MPPSPRELIKKGQVEAGREAFTRLRTDLASEDVIYQEFDLMCRQIDFELHRQMSWHEGVKTFRHRILISIGVVSITSLCGFNVVVVSLSSPATGSFLDIPIISVQGELEIEAND